MSEGSASGGVGSPPIHPKDDRPVEPEWVPVKGKPHLMRNTKTGKLKTIDYCPPWPSIPFV